MITATTRAVLPCPPPLFPANPIVGHRVPLGSHLRVSHISNVLNVMWTLLPHFATDFLCFHPLTDSFFCKTGGMGVPNKFYQPKKKPLERKRAPDCLGGGESGAW